jgi:hypothetical protein
MDTSNLASMRYLCMSYNKYLIMRKKLSNACSKNNNDEIMREKLVQFIRQQPDYELKRQIAANEAVINPLHKEIHTAKIADLLEPASKMYEQREAYKKLRVLEAETRLAKHISLMEEDRSRVEENKAQRIEKSRLNNIAKVALQKQNADAIRLARAEKKKSL